MSKKPLDDATKKRLRAGRMLLARPADVALAVGVARQTVYTWKALLDEGGIDGLRAMPGRGRPAKLEPEQLAELRGTLLQSPTAHGFGTELWTLKRVGSLIKRTYCVGHGWTRNARVWILVIRGAIGAPRNCSSGLQLFRRRVFPVRAMTVRKPLRRLGLSAMSRSIGQT